MGHDRIGSRGKAAAGTDGSESSPMELARNEHARKARNTPTSPRAHSIGTGQRHRTTGSRRHRGSMAVAPESAVDLHVNGPQHLWAGRTDYLLSAQYPRVDELPPQLHVRKKHKNCCANCCCALHHHAVEEPIDPVTYKYVKLARSFSQHDGLCLILTRGVE